MWQLQNVPGSTYFVSDKYKTGQPFKLHLLQNSLLVQLHTSASDCKCCKHSWKPFCDSIFSSSVAFSMSVASQQRRPFSADFSHGNGKKSADARSVKYGRCSSFVTLIFAKKSFTKADRCSVALSWICSQLLVLHFSGLFLPTASLRRRMMSIYISSFPVAIPANYTSEFPERFEAARYF